MIERQETGWGPGSAGIRGGAVGFSDGFDAGAQELGRQNLRLHQPTPSLGFFSGSVSRGPARGLTQDELSRGRDPRGGGQAGVS